MLRVVHVSQCVCILGPGVLVMICCSSVVGVMFGHYGCTAL